MACLIASRNRRNGHTSLTHPLQANAKLGYIAAYHRHGLSRIEYERRGQVQLTRLIQNTFDLIGTLDNCHIFADHKESFASDSGDSKPELPRAVQPPFESARIEMPLSRSSRAIGDHLAPRDTTLPFAETQGIRQILAERAFRMMIANSPAEDIKMLRQRVVDSEASHSERDQWSEWREAQNEAERDLLKRYPENCAG